MIKENLMIYIIHISAQIEMNLYVHTYMLYSTIQHARKKSLFRKSGIT